MDNWSKQRHAAPPPAPTLDVRDYVCPFCGDGFVLRKHLGVHIARRHGVPAPVRLYTHHPTCLACLKHFHTVPRLQGHLRSSTTCMLRVCQLLPPMSFEEVRQAEASDKAHLKRLRKGDWMSFHAVQPVCQALGPQQPSRDELRQWLGEDAPLTLLRRDQPDPTLLAWILSEVPKRTTEPPRTGTHSFWTSRVGCGPNRFT